MYEVAFPVGDLRRLGEFVAADRLESLLELGEHLRQALGGAAVVCVNSTASGGGVAEMLQMLLRYVRGVGIDVRWLVIDGDERFYAITKRLHNHLHGFAGDGGPLGEDEQRHYQDVLQANAAQLALAVRPGDIVLVHDPQPAGLIGAMRQRGAPPSWSAGRGETPRRGVYSVGRSHPQQRPRPAPRRWAKPAPALDRDHADALAEPLGRVAAPSTLPALGETFEVVLLARHPDGSGERRGLHSATTAEVRVTWPT